MRFSAHQTLIFSACLVTACAQHHAQPGAQPGVSPKVGEPTLATDASKSVDYSNLDADEAAKLLGAAEADINRWASLRPKTGSGVGPAPAPSPPPADPSHAVPDPGSPAPGPSNPVAPKPSTRPFGVTKEPGAQPLQGDSFQYKNELASRCTRMCRALASMRRATDRLCELTGEGDERCEDARTRVRRAAMRVTEVCPKCSAR